MGRNKSSSESRLHLVATIKGSPNAVGLFLCDCGTLKAILKSSVSGGRTRSCGCLRKEVTAKNNTTHASSKEKEYANWKAIRARCYNKNMACYNRYGGRGITICKRWEKFENFLEDMGPRPSNKHSVERIDNDGNYEPANCKWATPHEQANNKRNNLRLSAYGVVMTPAQWAKVLGVPADRIRHRVKIGWSDHSALFTPKMGYRSWDIG